LLCAQAAGSFASASQRRPLERAASTIADRMSITRPVDGAVELVSAAVDEILPVDDEVMVAAMRLLIEKAGLLTEPSGAAGIAAVMQYPERFRGARLAAVITGSNVDPRLLRGLAD